jgi:hypothetical protein
MEVADLQAALEAMKQQQQRDDEAREEYERECG